MDNNYLWGEQMDDFTALIWIYSSLEDIIDSIGDTDLLQEENSNGQERFSEAGSGYGRSDCDHSG